MYKPAKKEKNDFLEDEKREDQESKVKIGDAFLLPSPRPSCRLPVLDHTLMAAVARAPVNLREPLLPIIVGDHRIKRGGGGGDVAHGLNLVVGLEQQRAEAIRAGAQGEHCGGLRWRRGGEARRGDGGGRRILGEEVLQDHPAGGGVVVEIGGGESDVFPNFFHGFGEAGIRGGVGRGGGVGG